MDVKDVMTRGVESIQSSETVLHAARMMDSLNVGVLPVFDGNKLEGVITDRDIVVRVIASALNPAHTSIGEVMSKDVQSCSESTSIEEAAKIMENYKIRRLLVKNNEGAKTGIVSLGDLAVHTNKDFSGEILQQVSEPSSPKR
jgi:CBS domain-containing protein